MNNWLSSFATLTLAVALLFAWRTKPASGQQKTSPPDSLLSVMVQQARVQLEQRKRSEDRSGFYRFWRTNREDRSIKMNV